MAFKAWALTLMAVEPLGDTRSHALEPTETYADPYHLPPPETSVELLSAKPRARPPRRRVKVILAGLALAAMLGGGAVSVFAASPDPSASPTPATSPSTNNGSGGTTQPGTHGNCPHDQSTNSSSSTSTSG
jgi:hypothetical protein